MTVTPFLMFEGVAEAAMQLYVSAFDDGEIVEMAKYGPEAGDVAGKVRLARFRVGGQMIMTIDSPAPHEFTFTPSMSLFVVCSSAEEFERVFASLGEGGKVMMPPDNYGFSQRFAWFSDKFGVSWQLNLE